MLCRFVMCFRGFCFYFVQKLYSGNNNIEVSIESQWTIVHFYNLPLFLYDQNPFSTDLY